MIFSTSFTEICLFKLLVMNGADLSTVFYPGFILIEVCKIVS